MKHLTAKKLLGILVFSLLLSFGLSTDAMGQGRGHRSSHWDKKCSKFVNCHDARDGRWDGRGRHRNSRFTNIFGRNRRDRDRDRDRGHHRRWRRNRNR